MNGSIYAEIFRLSVRWQTYALIATYGPQGTVQFRQLWAMNSRRQELLGRQRVDSQYRV